MATQETGTPMRVTPPVISRFCVVSSSVEIRIPPIPNILLELEDENEVIKIFLVYFYDRIKIILFFLIFEKNNKKNAKS